MNPATMEHLREQAADRAADLTDAERAPLALLFVESDRNLLASFRQFLQQHEYDALEAEREDAQRDDVAVLVSPWGP